MSRQDRGLDRQYGGVASQSSITTLLCDLTWLDKMVVGLDKIGGVAR